MISETVTDMSSRPAKVLKKSLLKSMSGGSVDKSERTLDIRATEVKSPSPIPEDPVEEDVNRQSKQSTSAAAVAQGREVGEKDEQREEVEQELSKRDEQTSEEDKEVKEKKEEKEGKEGKEENEEKEEEPRDKNDPSGAKKVNSDNAKETNKEADSEKSVKPLSAQEEESAFESTTKLRGKSKATGQIMGGWI